MSEKKSLGSSPIGYKSENSSKMGFIPDLDTSKASTEESLTKKESPKSSKETSEPVQNEKKKKVVSYSLETNLIDEVKATAAEREIYYSTLVSRALKKWLSENA